MYIEDEKRQIEINQVSKQIEDLENIKKYGDDFIREFEEKQKRNPSQMEEYQFKINNTKMLLLNYDSIMQQLAIRLNQLMMARV
jgi:hypothetical protein